MFRSCFSCL